MLEENGVIYYDSLYLKKIFLKKLEEMDYIKSWFEYFRGNNTNRSREKEAEDLKNEFLKYGNNSSAPDHPRRRDVMETDPLDIMKIFFSDSSSQPDQSNIMSNMDNQWPFGGDMFRSANEMHREFVNLVNEMHKGLLGFQDFVFGDNEDGNLGNCLDCDRPQVGESLRDSYLRVPPLVTSDNNGNTVNVIIPGNEGSNIKSTESTSNTIMPHFKRTDVVVSVHPNGYLQIIETKTDSSGNTEKTVTKLNLKDKM